MISAITLVTALVFLCPNIAKAESPVQPLQVVTYSDTSTQLRISGTAERLHYNVDSFQVVFTNPPNNYGTACTPVLVSFRFYNSSDSPAYVGQAEFEIVCTNGTGSTNLIIYGYDQISTDLFVAESTYSTAEVGRIGIGASNDFAYYTGFVVPPKTSLYFSAIVYVNASAYEGVSNVTGSQEQVNQLTMSSLNLYTNQISFSDAYPYHGMPIDFSAIIDAITGANSVSLDDINDTLVDIYNTNSTAFNNIINAITYSGSTSFSPYYDSLKSGNYNLTGTNITNGYIRYVIDSPIIDDFDLELDAASDTLLTHYRFHRHVSISISFRANENKALINPDVYIRLYKFGNNNRGIDNIQVMSNFIVGYNNIEGNIFPRYIYNQGYYGICATGYHYLSVDYDLYFSDSSTTLTLPTSASGLTNIAFNDGVVTSTESLDISEIRIINNINNTLTDLYNAYSQVNGLDNSSDISSDVADVSDSNHIIEESYYSANASAIEATGLSNYRFSNEQNNGIGKVADDFMLLWNALGSWNGVYVFSLTMALATFIMRHGGLFTVRRQVSDKGGEGD